MAEPFVIGGVDIKPGTRHTIHLPVAPLYTHTEMAMPVRVIRGKKDGPRLFISAAIHGDEINGVEIIRRLLKLKLLRQLRGTLIAVPVVNVYGYMSRTRYLPDRRDLNRFFPGSPGGSMASRLAHLFIQEIVQNSTHGIDLHTGAIYRGNLPQIRIRPNDEEVLRLARAFRVPVIMRSDLLEGSLREAVLEHDVPVLLYEGGEALRLDEQTLHVGLRGILSVMRTLKMLPGRARPPHAVDPFISEGSRWVRSPASGTLTARKGLGDQVATGELLGVVTSPFGEEETPVNAPVSGLIVGQTMLPLVYEGEALFNIAHLSESTDVTLTLDRFHANLETYLRENELL